MYELIFFKPIPLRNVCENRPHAVVTGVRAMVRKNASTLSVNFIFYIKVPAGGILHGDVGIDKKIYSNRHTSPMLSIMRIYLIQCTTTHNTLRTGRQDLSIIGRHPSFFLLLLLLFNVQQYVRCFYKYIQYIHM